jgi:hypothetical protein
MFFRQYVRHLLGIEPIRKVTCPGSTREGAGSQALLMMVAFNFARACGLTYVHSPFTEILPLTGGSRCSRAEVAAWEAHFNLGVGELVADGDNRGIVNFTTNRADILPLLGITGIDLYRIFETTVPEFRRKYYSNKPRRTNEVLSVCVHVRRGDVTPDILDMWTSTSFIAETITRVRAILEAHCFKYKICVLSQANFVDITDLNVPDADVFIDADPIWSMQEAIEADVLIMAKSSFSYVAALISDGIKIYEPCGYPPLSSWVTRGPNSEFDATRFERQLLQYMETR